MIHRFKPDYKCANKEKCSQNAQKSTDKIQTITTRGAL